MISPGTAINAVNCRRDPGANKQDANFRSVTDGDGLAIINKLLVLVLSCSSSGSDLSRGRLCCGWDRSGITEQCREWRRWAE